MDLREESLHLAVIAVSCLRLFFFLFFFFLIISRDMLFAEA
jgi:hypothetical protein